MIKILRANNVIDVFFGAEGFEQKEWSRFLHIKKGKQSFLKFLKGAVMPDTKLAELKKKLGVE